MFGKKRATETCPSCDRQVHAGQKVCQCGAATRHMSFDERTAWEVEQWRSHQAQAAS